MNGADLTHIPSTQSYDYDAPLNEAGDPTPKYFAIKNLLSILRQNHINLLTVPASSEKISYEHVKMNFLGEIVDLLDILCPAMNRIRSRFPKTMEQIDFGYGYVLYETKLNRNGYGTLRVQGINDRGFVMINGQLRGIISINGNSHIKIESKEGKKLQLLVENMGRINMGPRDPKGIVGQVTFDDEILEDWIIYPLTLENIFDKVDQFEKRRTKNSYKNDKYRPFSPSMYFGRFQADIIGDTFFNPDGWTKGQFFVNKFNVGRYWPDLGPQVTLYVPKFFLKRGENIVIMLELEKAGNCRNLLRDECYVSFADKPFLNKSFNYPL